jgi:RNA polymerase sigma-70 factor (ECF subfamily)
VAAARDGDQEAFKDLYRMHVTAIFGFIAARTNRQTAEDLTADTFARAYAAIGRYEQRDVPFRSWLFRIAHNLVVGRARRRDATDTMLEPEHAQRVAAGTDVAHDVTLSIEAERLRECMAQLSDAHSTVLDLRYLRELSVSETGAVLGLGEEAVRALTYRALRALRAAFGTATTADEG